MRVELFPFQKRALADIRMKTAEAMGSYHRTHAPQVVSFTAPTGAGKTIIMSALIEAILFGDEEYMEQPDAYRHSKWLFYRINGKERYYNVYFLEGQNNATEANKY